MKKNQQIDIFRKWIVLKSEYKADNGSWILYEDFPRARWTWEFTENRNRFQDGTVERTFDGQKSLPDEVWFNPENRELCIDVSWRDEKGYKPDVEEEYFRVERNGARGLILYNLEYVESEPDGYHERFIIRKYSLPAVVKQYIACLPIRPKRK